MHVLAHHVPLQDGVGLGGDGGKNIFFLYLLLPVDPHFLDTGIFLHNERQNLTARAVSDFRIHLFKEPHPENGPDVIADGFRFQDFALLALGGSPDCVPFYAVVAPDLDLSYQGLRKHIDTHLLHDRARGGCKVFSAFFLGEEHYRLLFA